MVDVCFWIRLFCEGYLWFGWNVILEIFFCDIGCCGKVWGFCWFGLFCWVIVVLLNVGVWLFGWCMYGLSVYVVFFFVVKWLRWISFLCDLLE